MAGIPLRLAPQRHTAAHSAARGSVALDVLAAHMAGDFLLQTPAMARHKLEDPKVRARHVAAYTACFVPVAALHVYRVSRRPRFSYGSSRIHCMLRAAVFLTSVAAAHWVTDSWRWASGEEWPLKPVLVDQALHALQLALLIRVL